ncbi:MAG: T9SS type A sorting domain-containing protein [Saprospiraceae bacterium]
MQKLKIIIALAISLSCSISLLAQGHRHHNPEKMLEKMTTELELSDTQVTQLKAVFATIEKERAAARENDSEDFQSRKAQRRAHREAHQTAIKAVLTPAQWTRFETTMKKHRKGRKGKHHHLSPEDREALQKETKAYKTTYILPTLQKQRAKLTASISTEDQALITELRPKLATEKAARKAAHQQNKKQHKKGRKSKKQKSKYAATIEELVARYEVKIDDLFAEIETERLQWDKDLKAIKDKYHPKRKQKESTQGDKAKQSSGKTRHELRKMRKKAKRAMRKKIHFLFLDANEAATTTKINPIRKINIYPNPSVNENTLQFALSEAGYYNIELYNEAGQLIRSIKQSQYPEGKHQIQVDLSQLKNGAYYYRITGKEGQQQTQKFMLVRK